MPDLEVLSRLRVDDPERETSHLLVHGDAIEPGDGGLKGPEGAHIRGVDLEALKVCRLGPVRPPDDEAEGVFGLVIPALEGILGPAEPNAGGVEPPALVLRGGGAEHKHALLLLRQPVPPTGLATRPQAGCPAA